MQTLSLWAWYLILVIVVWILLVLPRVGGMPLITSLLAATLFALSISLVLLPYYIPLATGTYDKLSLSVFVVTITVLPVLLLLVVWLTKEYHLYWGGNKDGGLHQAIRPDLYPPEGVEVTRG